MLAFRPDVSFIVIVASVWVAVTGCARGEQENITSMRPYADVVGVEYEVIVDDLYGYGIYASRDTKAIGWITLIPGVGIGGSEVAFRRHVPKGQVIRILSAWRQPLLFDNDVYYRVAIESPDFPSDVPIKLELFRGNEGEGAELNPRVYRRLRHRVSAQEYPRR
jgi:hypothetical protein